MISNAVLGVALFEWAWAKVKYHRQPNKDLFERFPMYRRNDALKWQKSRLYIGAITVLVPRMIIGIVCFVSLLFWLNILMLGHKEGRPLTGVRKFALSVTYKVHVVT